MQIGEPPEIDAYETAGYNPIPSRMYTTVHMLENGIPTQLGSSYTGPDYSLDFHIFGMYAPESVEFTNTQASLAACDQLISQGVVANTEILGFQFIAQQAQLDPMGDSGFPRPVGGNFTNEGLFYFALINTNTLPGLITPITGLPSNCSLSKDFLEHIISVQRLQMIHSA